jgi:hypothetical protein
MTDHFNPHDLDEHRDDLAAMARHFRAVITTSKEEHVARDGPGDLVPLIIFSNDQACGLVMPMSDVDETDATIQMLPALLGQLRARSGRPNWVLFVVEALDFYEDTPDGPRTTPPGPLLPLWRRGDQRVREALLAFYGTADKALMEVLPYRYGGGSVEWLEARTRPLVREPMETEGNAMEHLVLAAFQVLFMTPEAN